MHIVNRKINKLKEEHKVEDWTMSRIDDAWWEVGWSLGDILHN
jgi:hypothetical protein